MSKNKSSKFLKAIFLCVFIQFMLLTVQIINGKYSEDLPLVLLWYLLLNFPLLFTLAYNYLDADGFSLKHLMLNGKEYFFSVVFYYVIILIILVFVIPLSWIISGIGYRPIFYSTLVVLGLVECYLLFLTAKFRKSNSEISNLEKVPVSLYANMSLKGIQPDFKNALVESQKLIGEGQTLKAIDTLDKYYKEKNAKLPNELILLRGDFKKTKKEVDLGLIEFNQAKIVFNRINNSLLEHISSFLN